MGFDRSKLKASSLAALKTQEEQAQEKRPTRGGDAQYINIEDGKNVVRIYPPHPIDGQVSTFTEAKCISYLKVTQPKRDEHKKVIEGEFEIKTKAVFNSKVHGNLKTDLVEKYMDIAKNIAIPNFTVEDAKAKKIWGIITIPNLINKDDNWAIKPNDSWVAYASKKNSEGVLGEPGLLEFKKTVKTGFLEAASDYNDGDMHSADPYTDPDDGICAEIVKSGKGLQTEYKVSLETKRVDKVRSEYVLTPISDDLLDKWSKMPSLKKIFVNSFKKSDFEMQIEGLENLDKHLAAKGYPINVTKYPEFEEAVMEIMDQLPAEEEQQDSPKQEEKKPTATTKPSRPTSTSPKRTLKVEPPKPAPEPVPEPEPEPEEEEQAEIEVPVTQPAKSDLMRSIREKLGKKV